MYQFHTNVYDLLYYRDKIVQPMTKNHHKSNSNQLFNNQNTLIDINNAIYLATNLFNGLSNIGLNRSPCFHINSYSHDKFYYFYLFSFFSFFFFDYMYSSINPYFTLKTRTCLSFIYFLFVSFSFSSRQWTRLPFISFLFFLFLLLLHVQWPSISITSNLYSCLV